MTNSEAETRQQIMDSDYKAKINNIFNLPTFKLLNGCSFLTCILHNKSNKENINLFSIGILDKRNVKDNRVLLKELSGNKYSIFLYREYYNLKSLKFFLLSYDGEKLVDPIDNVDLKITNSSFKDISLLDSACISDLFKNLIPDLRYNYLIFEYFILNKEHLYKVDDEQVKLENFYNIMQEGFNIDLEYFNDRLGNILILIPELRIRSKFFGVYFDEHKFFIENYIDKDINKKDLILYIKSEMNNEILDSKIIYPIKEKILIDRFSKDGKITLEIWSRSEKKIIYRDSGILVKSIHTNIGLIAGQRKVIRYEKDGKLKEEKIVELISKEYISDKHIKKDISSTIVERYIKNKKNELLKNKELMQYKGNEHKKAVQDIIDIFNKKTKEFLYLWDPYFSEKDLSEYIPYIESLSLKINIISDFASGLKNAYKGENDFKEKIKKVINELKNAKISNIEFRYTIGNLGFPFHDRFIITKDNCWMIGSSFNSIGDAHSLIVKINNPDIIQEEFEKLWINLERQV